MGWLLLWDFLQNTEDEDTGECEFLRSRKLELPNVRYRKHKDSRIGDDVRNRIPVKELVDVYATVKGAFCSGREPVPEVAHRRALEYCYEHLRSY